MISSLSRLQSYEFLLVVLRLYGLATVKQAPMDAPSVSLLRCLIAFALRGVVTLESRDVFVTTELLRVVHANTLYRNGQLAHFLEIDGISMLHIEFHRIEQLPQYKPYIRGLGGAV